MVTCDAKVHIVHIRWYDCNVVQVALQECADCDQTAIVFAQYKQCVCIYTIINNVYIYIYISSNIHVYNNKKKTTEHTMHFQL